LQVDGLTALEYFSDGATIPICLYDSELYSLMLGEKLAETGG
jgi:hypothetical protein